MQESCKCEKLRRKTISVVPVSHEVLSSKLCYLLCWGPPPCWAAAHCWQWWRCGKCRRWTPAPSWAGTWPNRKVTEQNTYEHYLPASNYTVPFSFLILSYSTSTSLLRVFIFPLFCCKFFPSHLKEPTIWILSPGLTWSTRSLSKITSQARGSWPGN